MRNFDVPGRSMVYATNGIAATSHPIASKVAIQMLEAGGNAVDAAIATGMALAVTHPAAGNIGGGGFMVVRFPNGTATALDFREKAPLAADARMWLDENGEYSREIHHDSHRAVGVPGTVAGFDKAHRLYGSLNWERLVYPAVVLAEDGFELSDELAESLARLVERRAEYPATVGAFSRDGTPYRGGDTLRQPDLARTLRRIMLQRRDGFYRGETARLIAREMERGGGLITESDLEIYQARERAPVLGSYKGYQIVSMPPPSSGGVAVVEMLNILEGFDLQAMGHNTVPYIHHLAESMRRAYRDRARYLADRDFVDVPMHRLTSPAYAADLRAQIDPDRASVSRPSDVEQAYESPETTHFSVVDSDGLAVSVTYTLEQGFGSGIVVPGAGFLLNNEMGDFNAAPGLTDERGLIGTRPNLARPEQRMLSSMSPTIVMREGQPLMTVGAAGGPKIITQVLQAIIGYFDLQKPIEQAVSAPRIHHQWRPDRLTVERSMDSRIKQELEDRGHRIHELAAAGTMQAIVFEPATKMFYGVSDPRVNGLAQGTE